MWARQRSARGRSPRASAIGAKARQDGVQEPAQPDALAPALVADPVHAVVPVARADQRQAVGADREAPVERARAVLEQRRRVRRAPRLEVGVRLVRPQGRPVEERDHLVEDRRVAGDREVAIDGVGQPEAIVGDARPDAPAGRRMPPVLDVSLDELAGRGPQEVLARERRGSAIAQGHDVLELVAEAVGAAGLVERGPRPEPAGERLVEQPAVEHDVHRAVRRPHLDRRPGCRPRSVATPRSVAAWSIVRPRRIRSAAAAAPSASPSRTTISVALRRRARSWSAARRTDRGRRRRHPAAGTRGPGRPAAPERRCGRGTRSDRPSTPSAARRGRRRRRGRRTRCSMGCARGAPGLRLELGDDPGGAGPARGAEHPLDVGGHRQAPRAPGPVLDGQAPRS